MRHFKTTDFGPPDTQQEWDVLVLRVALFGMIDKCFFEWMKRCRTYGEFFYTQLYILWAWIAYYQAAGCMVYFPVERRLITYWDVPVLNYFHRFMIWKITKYIEKEYSATVTYARGARRAMANYLNYKKGQ